jgi:(p)ppGpp synthase/HD superfamily hydrolase
MDHKARRSLRISLGIHVRELSKRSGVEQDRYELAEIGLAQLTPQEQGVVDEVLRHAIKERTAYFAMAMESLKQEQENAIA